MELWIMIVAFFAIAIIVTLGRHTIFFQWKQKVKVGDYHANLNLTAYSNQD
jgi:hypothetical protein